MATVSDWTTLDFIASRVQAALSGGLVTDEGRIDLDLVRDSVNVARARHLQEIFRRRIGIPPQYFQRLCCLEIACEDITCEDQTMGKEYLVEIPPVIGGLGRMSIRYVGDPKGLNPFTYASSLAPKLDHPYVKKKGKGGRYTMRGDDMLVLANLPTAGMEFICVELMASDPVHPLILSCDKSGRYPIPLDELEAIELRAYERYREMVGLQPDLANDAIPKP